MEWYRMEIDEVFKRLETSEKGLSEGEAKDRLEKEGPNKLPEGKGLSRIEILLHQFKSPLIYILLVAAVVTAVLGEYIDTGVIAAVLILNAVIGYFQEAKAEKSMRALQGMVVPRAKVLREEEKEMPSEGLVPGDIVFLSSGMRVPADVRLFRTTELSIEEAALTGESLPVEKTKKAIAEENLTPGDRVNMGFMGTIVVSGRGTGVVVNTGQKTILGNIAREMEEVSVTVTPLQQKIVRFAHFIGFLVLGSALAIAALGLFLGMTITEIFKIAVAASVAAVPEGLPVVVTITMAIGVSRMAKRHAIIRKLPAVETLGSTTLICSDKTGTLTKNEMTVKAIYDGHHAYEVTGSGYDPEGHVFLEWEGPDVAESEGMKLVARIGMLCNESRIYEEDGNFKVDGDPTEGALIVSAMKAGLNPKDEKAQYAQLSIIPFESERGFMATLHEHEGKKLIFLKGAPEKVLEMCSHAPSGEKLNQKKVFDMAEHFAEDGMRVLGMAFKKAGADIREITHHDTDQGGFIFAGLQGMIDPPRPEAVEAVDGCKKAGIRVAMITGDHAVTAAAIGKMIGIAGKDSKALTGRELEPMDDDTLFEKVQDTAVFARVSPQHKLRIVRQFKRHGEVVAVTGDGVNDAPALKAAHIGVAMGKTGTDVAREASDMVITDDNFSSIFHAVEQGRVVFDNIRKVTMFLIPTGFAAILSILIAMILDMPIPYVAAQLLWINLVTNGLQDVALAFEPAEKDVLQRKPRDAGEGIMSRLMLERSLLVGILMSAGVIYNFSFALEQGVSLERARTVAVTTMVLFQFFQAWNSRSELQSVFRIDPLSNPLLFYGTVAAFLAQIAVIYLPAMQWVFRTEALDGSDWARIVLVSLVVVVAVEIDKALRRRKTRV